MHGEQAVNPIHAYIYFDILCKGSAKVGIGKIQARLQSLFKGENGVIHVVHAILKTARQWPITSAFS